MVISCDRHITHYMLGPFIFICTWNGPSLPTLLPPTILHYLADKNIVTNFCFSTV